MDSFMATATESPSTRDEIVRVASNLFYEHGFHCTGVQQIINEAGVAKGTFYTHFKSKEELGVAWLKARHHIWNQWLEDFIAKRRGAESKINGIFDFLGEWMENSHYRGCAFLNTLAETPDGGNPLRAVISHHKRDLLQRIETLVAEHLGPSRKKDSAKIARALFILFEGALVEMQNFEEQWPLEAAKREISRLLNS